MMRKNDIKNVSEIMYKRFFKRPLDFCLALLVLVCIGWFLIIIAIWLHFANKGGRAFFLQDRSGKDAKIFKVVKFKTMTDERDADGNLLPDSIRLTRVGKFVRKTSIDELPQIINVLKGDMSLIGPRPLLPEYTQLYNQVEKRRLNVRPGISGWAQVHGRNSLKLSKRFEMDVYYVNNISFLLDVRIVWMTFINLFKTTVVVDRAELKGVDDLGFDKIAFGEKNNKNNE